jgi:NTE family protein
VRRPSDLRIVTACGPDEGTGVQVPGREPETIDERDIDLVLEGGGVKGVGLIGAVKEIEAAGFRIRRVAGTSAGAIAAALIACNLAAAETSTDAIAAVERQIATIEYAKFTEASGIRDHLGKLGDLEALVHHLGLYSGDYLVEWLGGILADIGITTFGQLRRDDLGDDFPYTLVVHTADITNEMLVRLPYDYPRYDRDPDDQLIVDAVRASMSIPFFFEPVQFELAADSSELGPRPVTWVDGGLLSNFPMEVFNDRHHGVVVDPWPTLGVKLTDQRPAIAPPTTGPLSELFQILKTVLNNANRYYISPEKSRSTIFVDSAGVNATDFAIDAARSNLLFENGRKAAQTWLQEFAACVEDQQGAKQ